MAGFDRIAQHALASRARYVAYLIEDLGLMFQGNAVMDGLPQRAGRLQLARMPKAGLTVARVIGERFEEIATWHIRFL